jgi:hypothetical protein
MIDRLTWTIYLKELEEFKSLHGHTIVPDEEPYLALYQITLKIVDLQFMLEPEQLNDLKSIDFMLDKFDRSWERKYLKLKKIFDETGS